MLHSYYINDTHIPVVASKQNLLDAGQNLILILVIGIDYVVDVVEIYFGIFTLPKYDLTSGLYM